MNGQSFYKEKLKDRQAIYFTEEFFDVKNDGSIDVSVEFQNAINSVVKKAGYGVLFVPEGKYLLSRTIYVPKAVRIIGYGKNRPEFILKDNAKGFNAQHNDVKGGYKYLFWFVNKMEEDESKIQDANPGTFYSAISNINVSLGQGNSYAVAFRTHYAQHCFINHIDINVQSGMAGIYDVGNEMEDVFINGGKYGIITTKCSPGWPFVMIDTRFFGQTVASIKTREAGFNIIRTHSVNTSKFIDVDEGFFEKIYIEDSVFEDMEWMMHVSDENNSLTQINVRNCYLKDVENIIEFKDTGRKIENDYSRCKLKKYVHGISVSDVSCEKQMRDEMYRYADDVSYNVLSTDLTELPPMKTWANAQDIGLIGDGVTDDTEALKSAVDKYETIYFPQGEYIISDTIKLKDNTAFIGMNPVSTQIILKENSEPFTGFGKSKGLIESGKGRNILFGIGVNTGGRNPRACGVKWRANQESYINDVKFFGGHGDLVKGTGAFKNPYDEGRARDAHLERIWDYQYPSLLICNEGGGVFKDLWSASPYASAGLEIRNTKTPIRIYCLSLEHHCRCELRMINAENVTIYGFQSEEEKAEGEFALPIELHNCTNITFATAYCFRTVFVQKPFPYCVKTWNCENINFLNVHNYSQMKYTIDNFLLDVNSGVEIRPWQAALVEVTGKAECEKKEKYSGFRFADGGCCDSKGNFYFLDSMDKRVYKIDGNTLAISMVFESLYKVNSIGFDTKDNIVIIGEYAIPKDAVLNGEKLINKMPPDSYGTSYGFWYNSQALIVAFTLDENREIKELDKINIGEIEPERVLYPGNRWRDGSDFENVVQYNPQEAFVAPDGVTIIPCHYDLIRANNLAVAGPGEKIYSIDELYKRVYSCNVTEEGLLINPKVVIQEGDYCVRKVEDRLYVGDDDIKVYEAGRLIKTIHVEKRPSTFDLKNKILFVTARNMVYVIKE